MVLEKTLENPLGWREIKAVNPQGNQSWICTGRTIAEAEAPILWPPDAKSQLIGKDPDAGKDWGQKEKGATEDGMIRYHHQLNGHEPEQTPGAWHAAVHVTKSQTWLTRTEQQRRSDDLRAGFAAEASWIEAKAGASKCIVKWGNTHHINSYWLHEKSACVCMYTHTSYVFHERCKY